MTDKHSDFFTSYRFCALIGERVLGLSEIRSLEDGDAILLQRAYVTDQKTLMSEIQDVNQIVIYSFAQNMEHAMVWEVKFDTPKWKPFDMDARNDDVHYERVLLENAVFASHTKQTPDRWPTPIKELDWNEKSPAATI